MRGLPSGTVTFLFTDIEGSTRLLHELGERYADVLAEHNRLLREALSRHGGLEVGTQGDSFFVAFADAGARSPPRETFRPALAGGPVRVRIGIHTGEAVVTDEGYVGIDVHRAARIMSAGHGGQVLLSETTRHVSRERGARRPRRAPPRGPRRPAPALPARRPRLSAAAHAYRTNLPIQPTPLVGRRARARGGGRARSLQPPGDADRARRERQDAARAAARRRRGRAVSRRRLLGSPPGRPRPRFVERAIRTSVGADDGLIDYVANKRLLVLLDNFEQVVEAAPAVSALVGGTPHAKVLVTSREPLHVESERRYPVEPLRDADAEILFVERGTRSPRRSARRRRSARSAAGSTGFRSRSSSRRHASRC